MALRKSQSFRADPNWCHICGLLIPPQIVSSTHDLFGTIDHVIPRSLGGANNVENRLPAHRFCNRAKGSLVEPFEKQAILWLQNQVMASLVRIGLYGDRRVREQKLAEARDRIDFGKEPRLRGWQTIQQWETDGGATIALE